MANVKGMLSKIKNSSKESRQNALIALFLVGIFAFVAIECYRVMNVKMETQTAMPAAVYDVIESRALFVRDETAVTGISGISVLSVADGEKVNAGGNIAMTFSSADHAQKYSSYLELEKERQYYEDIKNLSVGNATDIDQLESDIIEDVNEYIRSAAKSDIGTAEDYALELNDNLTKRGLLIGNNIDFTAALSETQGKMNALNVSACKPVSYITTDKSGIYSKYSDGCEGLFDYKNVADMDVDTFSEYLSAAVSSKASSENGGKVINSFIWYLCCVVDTESVMELEDGYNTQVLVKSTGHELKCKVVKGADVSLSDAQTLLVLSCNETDMSLASLRLEDIEIRVKSYEGVKVSSKAVRELDGEIGVYALVSNIAKWRTAEVLYTGDDYVILDYGENSEIKRYDEIIIQGKDVYDGRVYA